ncbi:MAG: extracellular solute-binding protein [Micromonosporaceae bacterium]
MKAVSVQAVSVRAIRTRAARGRRTPRAAVRFTGRSAGRVAAAMLASAAMLLTACSGGSSHAAATPLSSLGPTEGSLRLLGTPGYLEDGGTDPRVDWVLSFERRTGCKVFYTPVPDANSIPAAFTLHGRGFYDGVVAPPAVAGRLIGAGIIAPLNTRLVGGYASISREFRTQGAVESGGRTYGLPYVWSSYVLGYAASSVRPAPSTWSALFDPASAARYAGKIMLPDSPFTIALAAAYLKTAKPSLAISDPYELNGTQFAAAVALLKSVRRSITRYDSADPQIIDGLASGSAVLGAVLPRHVDVLDRAGRKIASAAPAQGTTGFADFWLMNARAPHPNCMYQWLTWSITPRVQQEVAEWTGTAPVNPAACDGLGRQVCGIYHVADPAYLGKVAFAQIPRRDCGDGKHDCAGWGEWQTQWRSIVG